MSEQQQQVAQHPEETTAAVPDTTKQPTADLTGDGDDLDLDDIIDISDLVEQSKNLAKNFKQRGGQ